MKKIVRFWWEGKFSDNRRMCIKSMYKNIGVKLEHICLKNYKDYEVSEHPIHPAFEYLTSVHQGDYMRAYITYFHGGGWADVKYYDYNWNQYFETLENSDKDGIGCRIAEVLNGEYKIISEDRWAYNFLSMAHFIFKPKSIIFKDYLERIEKILDEKFDALKENPGVHPYLAKQGEYGWDPLWVPEEYRDHKYPLGWLEISEQFYHSQYAYQNRTIFKMPIPHNHMTGFNHR